MMDGERKQVLLRAASQTDALVETIVGLLDPSTKGNAIAGIAARIRDLTDATLAMVDDPYERFAQPQHSVRGTVPTRERGVPGAPRRHSLIVARSRRKRCRKHSEATTPRLLKATVGMATPAHQAPIVEALTEGAQQVVALQGRLHLPRDPRNPSTDFVLPTSTEGKAGLLHRFGRAP